MIQSRRRVRFGPWKPGCEGLERRLALSGTGDVLTPPGDFLPEGLAAFEPPAAELLSVVATQPADGATVNGSVSTLVIAFDRPIDPGSLLGDVQLAMLLDDGSLTPVVDENVYTRQDADPLDARRLLVTLDFALAPGHYRMFLWGGSMIAAQDGTPIDPSATERPLADFTIASPGTRIDDARDLGRIGVEPLSLDGRLDLAEKPTEVALYRLELTPEHSRWRLGIELSAQRIGSPLDAALTLFNAQGRPLATAELGRPDAPVDPYLFAGLTPGTYYVGVSAAGNLPTSAGGYNLAVGNPGSLRSHQPGGRFRLTLVADPAETPTSLRDFQLDRADPSSTEPTGFRVRFSGPIRVASHDGTIFNTVSQGLELVDDRGQSWPVAGTSYDEATATLKYIFRDRLPAGNYSVRVPRVAGLSDLAGTTVVGRDGRPGTLARFAVRNPETPRVPTNLGSFYPGEVLEGRSFAIELKPGESRTYRYTNLYSDTYLVSAHVEGGPVAVTFAPRPAGADAGKGSYAHAGAPAAEVTARLEPGGSTTVIPLQVAEGQYEIRLVSQGGGPSRVVLTVGIAAYGWESLLANGVGQGSALALRLVSPSGGLAAASGYAFDSGTAASAPGSAASFPQASRGAEVVAVPGGSATITGNSAESPDGGLASSPAGSLASSAVTGLVGLPETAGLAVAPLGGGVTTLIASSSALVGAAPGAQGQGGAATLSAGDFGSASADDFGPSTTGALRWTSTTPAARDPRDGSAEGRSRYLASAPSEGDRIDGLLAQLDELLPNWFRSRARDEGPLPVEGERAPGQSIELAASGAAEVDPTDHPDDDSGASVDTRLSLGMVAILAIRLRDSAIRRARRTRRSLVAGTAFSSRTGTSRQPAGTPRNDS